MCSLKFRRSKLNGGRFESIFNVLHGQISMLFLIKKWISPVYLKNIQEYEKIFFAILFRLANNHDQPFVQNVCKNYDFAQQKKIAKYFAKFSLIKTVSGWLTNKIIFLISLLLLENVL